jgi:predicted nucleic acid-binding protein
LTAYPRQRAVLDASAVLPLLVPEEGSGAIRFLFDALETGTEIELHAPRLLHVECAHALLKYVRRGLLTPEAASGAYGDLLDLPIALHDLRPLTPEDFAEASERVIAAYDAVYLALARRLRMPLITNDRRLAEKCEGLQPLVLLDLLPTTLKSYRLH